jgi:uncharacterized ferritin-like protein (DUF455 family)
MQNLFEAVLDCIRIEDPGEKVACCNQLWRAWQTGELECQAMRHFQDYQNPGQPQNPVLVAPRDLPRRSIATLHGRAALLHSIAHIEFNAINLALDAVYRFQTMPQAFYADWLKVALEEAYHFELLNNHLRTLGYCYGDFVAHNGLWDMAMRCNESTLVRMAIIPRGMEARGLDVTPGITGKLKASGDEQAVKILEIIFRDEIGHVEIGSRWFNYCCDQQNLPRQETFEKLMRRFTRGKVKLPLHRTARKSAGFTEAELDFLEGLV